MGRRVNPRRCQGLTDLFPEQDDRRGASQTLDADAYDPSGRRAPQALRAGPTRVQREWTDARLRRKTLFLSLELAEDFLRSSAEEKGNSPKWVRTQRYYLPDWAEDLAGLSLKKLSLRDPVVPSLDRRKTARKFRIEVLKVFFNWMRKTRHLLSSAEDPTLDLSVPQSSPEKHRRRKIIPVETVFAARAHLAPKVRDSLDVLLATAWHGTERQRFAMDGEIIERPSDANPEAWPDDVAGVLVVKQKGVGVERWSVRAEVLDAARGGCS